MEGAILTWVLIGAGITAGVFLIARAVVEVSAVTYAAIERTITRRQAAQKSAALLAGAGAAMAVTALIFGIALLALFAGLMQSNLGQ